MVPRYLTLDEGYLTEPNFTLPVTGITLSGTGFRDNQHQYYSVGPLVCYQGEGDWGEEEGRKKERKKGVVEGRKIRTQVTNKIRDKVVRKNEQLKHETNGPIKDERKEVNKKRMTLGENKRLRGLETVLDHVALTLGRLKFTCMLNGLLPFPKCRNASLDISKVKVASVYSQISKC